MFKRGDQIAYIPNHAEDLFHKDVEFGFVTGVNSKFVFCRYWSKYNSEELRTTSCSESTPPECLKRYTSHSQKQINQLLEKIYETE